MFCKNCGNKLPENAIFCDTCGTKLDVPVVPQQPAYEAPQQPAYAAPQQPAYAAPQQPVYTAPPVVNIAPQVAPVVTPEVDSLATNTLVMGIIGLALSELGLPGLIVSNIALNKAAEFERKAGKLFGKAKVGRNLAKPGKIVGIVMTVFWAIYISVVVIAGIASAL